MILCSYCAFVSVHMKILVGDVAIGDVVCRVLRGFPINSLYTVCANSFVYHPGLMRHATGAFHWQE